MKAFDLVVVGSGAGLIVLETALAQGLRCALVEKDKFGGTCLNRGCIPSKMLVYPADLIREAQRSQQVGVAFGPPQADWDVISARMWKQIDQNKQIRESLLGTYNLEVFEGTGEFTGSNTMRVQLADGTYCDEFSGERFVLAAGARSAKPPVEGLDAVGYLTYESFFGEDYPKKPWKSLIIIGGGVIGAEFAHIFAAMGTKVTVIGRASHLVPEEEEEISAFVEKQFRAFQIRLLLGHAAIAANKNAAGKTVTARDKVTGQTITVEAEEILVATGTVPNSDLLRVDRAGIKTDKGGWVVTDEYLQTNRPDVWALGDLNGRFQFRHKANYEAGLVSRNLFFADKNGKAAADYTKVPWAVYTYPQVAHAGLTERQAREAGLKVFIGRNYFSEIGTGFAMGYGQDDLDNGFVKIIVGEHKEILGVHVAGFQAAALLQPFVYLMNAAPQAHTAADPAIPQPNGTFDPVLRSMVIHPSLSELAAWALDKIAWNPAPEGVDSAENSARV